PGAAGRLQERFALATSGLSGAGQNLLARVSLDGLSGQFILGLLLGVVWSPCVGPTLGAAITLASQGQDLARVTVAMALFGLGAGLPLVLIGLVSRQALGKVRGRLLSAGKLGKQVLGGVMLALGLLILSGADKLFETWVLQVAPEWLVNLTTSI
ncbi:MAG: cytochrome c biogenesis protein CcdA, partial [Hydrogenophilaceae bacterium]